MALQQELKARERTYVKHKYIAQQIYVTCNVITCYSQESLRQEIEDLKLLNQREDIDSLIEPVTKINV